MDTLRGGLRSVCCARAARGAEEGLTRRAARGAKLYEYYDAPPLEPSAPPPLPILTGQVSSLPSY